MVQTVQLLGKVVDTPVVYDMGHGPVQFLDKVVSMPVFGRCSFSARTLTRPLCSTTGVMVQTVQFWTMLLRVSVRGASQGRLDRALFLGTILR